MAEPPISLPSSPEESVQAILKALEARRSLEFRCCGETYLIQQDNNKGCDYLSLWRTGSAPVRLGEALFDIFDGVDADAVRELVNLPCLHGRSLLQHLQAGAVRWF